MAVWKLDLNFRALSQGWTESYYADFGVPGFEQILGIANKIAELRIALCGAPVQITSYAVSDPLTEGQQGETVDFRPIKVAVGPADGATDPSSSVNAVFRNGTQKRKRRIFMRGAPDDVITEFGQLKSVAWGVWNTKFQMLASYLLGIVNGQPGGIVYGWLSRKALTGPTAQSEVSYELPPDTLVPVFHTTKSDFFAADDVNEKRYVRIKGLNGSKSVLNGEMVVRVLTRTSFSPLKPIAAFPQTTTGTVTRYQATPTFVPADAIGVERAGRRAPGAPPLQRPGRSRAKPRG